MAVITTEWRERSHAWHMAERFLHGYPMGGQWHRPPFDVVAAYVDQRPKNDPEPGPRHEFNFRIYPTIAEALQAVAVLVLPSMPSLYPSASMAITRSTG